mmetsp:Transcript_19773/g.42980  ORF Transcript_19773/g.42980 Transcript_19773/m.42980 type:complete len:275 (-) Transcript_19773:236-1060(-)
MISSHLRRTGVQLGRALLEQRRFIRRPALNTSQLTEGRRTGALAMKVGMIPVWDTWGTRHATTVLQLDNCEVVQVKTEETDGYTALQLGVGVAKPSRVKRSTAGHVGKAGVEPKRKLGEFRVSADALLPAGTLINALHFVPGQLVDVCGTSKGKGFQGVMKLWNFKGGKATHGNSLSHRVMGSTGNCQHPGRMFKDKNMPGRMGDRVTVACMGVGADRSGWGMPGVASSHPRGSRWWVMAPPAHLSVPSAAGLPAPRGAAAARRAGAGAVEATQ